MFSLASERNNDHFEVWRSEMATGQYALLTSIPSQGTSTTAHHYEYLDHRVDAGRTYAYYLADVDANGIRTEHREWTRTVTATTEELLPASFSLNAYPNPFNPATTIAFTLPEVQSLDIVVYDLAGRKVQCLAHGPFAAGTHEVAFHGDGLPSGIYLVRLTGSAFAGTRKLLLLK